ncbi:hypothetical protein SpiGrapes_0698 [Sphaerochaeta pleomorpha str. Grapes]|uniref:Uncharacterized protein n=1 Tax=Sphaerochaeta pleomorpha (strain ATCC BAA-1885 / DSM 22778 / Grapes) TaxID=158190 RepID=G8QYH6_SPHPG|nr:hypothetical protein SpiGrapes_0698 [Sphaerochaeta pleomorpha str. Grapes]
MAGAGSIARHKASVSSQYTKPKKVCTALLCLHGNFSFTEKQGSLVGFERKFSIP